MSTQLRTVKNIIEPSVVTEGAGVRLQRSIATRELDQIDPFLLFDHFGSDNPDDYLAGFPMHPHRGIETVTYMLEGEVQHKDSIGNSGVIGSGDVQWMTSGRGIMHEEMPKRQHNRLDGFQLWVNMSSELKMSAPRYQDVPNTKIPTIVKDNGTTIKVIAGTFENTEGAVREIFVDPTYLDVMLPPNSEINIPCESSHNCFAYLYNGNASFSNSDSLNSVKLVVFNSGNEIIINTTDTGASLLFISGKPINEPVVRYGPFVMNTWDEIKQTLRDLEEGSFIEHN